MGQRGEPLHEGETVLLVSRRGEKALLTLKAGPQAVGESGVVRLDSQIGSLPGGTVDWGGREYRVLRPVLADLLAQLRRKAQIVTPKDALYLLYLAGIGPGTNVAEAGAGSGALTAVLAYTVGPAGHVHSYDRRAEFLDVARANLVASGLSDRVTFTHRDVAEKGFDVEGLDSIVLDLPEPWGVVPAARTALAIGGHLATYTPTYNQLERSVRALREAGFAFVRSVELLERELHVGDGGTRPDFDMLGHTGFLTGARRME